jgi:hypothetical protein
MPLATLIVATLMVTRLMVTTPTSTTGTPITPTLAKLMPTRAAATTGATMFTTSITPLSAVLGKDFVIQAEVSKGTAAALKDLYDAETPKHEIAKLQGDTFLSALKQLARGTQPEAAG